MWYRSKLRGFGLIGVLIAFGALGVLAFVFSDLLLTNKNAQVGIRHSLDYEIMRSNVLMVLKDSALCSAALKNKDNTAAAIYKAVAPFPSDTEKLGGIFLGSTPIAAMDQDLDSNLRISSMELSSTGIAPVSIPPNTLHTVDLVIQARRKVAQGIPLSNGLNPFRIKILTNPAGQILSCVSAATNIADSLKDILDSSNSFTAYDCKDDSNLHTLTVSCGAGMQLLTCTGAPGAQRTFDEAFWVVPDYANDACTLTFHSGKCDASKSWTRQRVTAQCFTI